MLGAVWGPGDALVNEIGWVSVFTCEDCFRCGSLWGSTVMKGDGQPEGCGHLRWVVVWDGAFHLLPLPPPECLLSETGWGDDEFLNTLTGLLTWQEGYISDPDRRVDTMERQLWGEAVWGRFTPLSFFFQCQTSAWKCCSPVSLR